MQKYVKPEITAVEIETADIIQTSGMSYGGAEGGDEIIGTLSVDSSYPSISVGDMLK